MLGLVWRQADGLELVTVRLTIQSPKDRAVARICSLSARGMLCGRRAQSSACPFRPGCHGCGHCEATPLPALCTQLRAQAAPQPQAARQRRRHAASLGALAGLPGRSLLLGPGSACLPPDQLPPAGHGRHIRAPDGGGGLSRRQAAADIPVFLLLQVSGEIWQGNLALPGGATAWPWAGPLGVSGNCKAWTFLLA